MTTQAIRPANVSAAWTGEARAIAAMWDAEGARRIAAETPCTHGERRSLVRIRRAALRVLQSLPRGAARSARLPG